ncbi:MAG TPA: PspC domain-containing protein [Allosphingosinicella sp.]
MQTEQFNLFTRPDTFFGVCEGLGEDLGIHANLFRVAFAALLFWNPPAALGAYAAAGVLVAATRFIAPNPRIAPAEAEQAPAAVEAEAEQLPLAA